MTHRCRNPPRLWRSADLTFQLIARDLASDIALPTYRRDFSPYHRLRPDKAPIEEAPPVPNASPRLRGAPDRERLSDSLVTKGDDLDLHKELRTGESRLEGRACREVGSERGPIRFVHLLESADVGEEDGGLHDILQTASSLGQLILDVREDILGLRLESRRRGPGLRVRADLSRYEHERSRDDGPGEG